MGGARPFSAAEGQLGQLARGALPTFLRLGAGALCLGWKPRLEKAGEAPAEPGYALPFSVAGYRLLESSAVPGLPRPAEPLVLYEFEDCPYCHLVREAVAILDLDVLFRPCPEGGGRFRPEGKAKSATFPYLEDPNTGRSMGESADIVEYLFETYGGGKDAVPWLLKWGALGTALNSLGLRASAGRSLTPSAPPPAEPLVLYGYEASPFCKLVRERLNDMELPHEYRSCARGSPKREEIFQAQGSFQAPFLLDPNRGICMFESTDILAHLAEHYGAEEA